MDEKIMQITNHINSIMTILNIEPTADNEQTGWRIAKMYTNELFKNANKDYSELTKQMTVFEAPNQNIIKVKGIKFTSTCEHHWLPFTGYADIEYIPSKYIIGLSKIPRVVKWFSKRPQVQERLTQEIGDYLVGIIVPQYLKVTLRDVKHSCVEARGVEIECSTDTKFIYGGIHNE